MSQGLVYRNVCWTLYSVQLGHLRTQRGSEQIFLELLVGVEEYQDEEVAPMRRLGGLTRLQWKREK